LRIRKVDVSIAQEGSTSKSNKVSHGNNRIEILLKMNRRLDSPSEMLNNIRNVNLRTN